MKNGFVFVDRRKGNDRRQIADPCKEMSLDLYHRKRRKSLDRRDASKTLTDDYYAYMQKVMDKIHSEQKKAHAQNRVLSA